MPKLDLTPWQPSAVFRPFMLLCMRKPDADDVNEINNPGFNKPLQDKIVPPMWRSGADQAHAFINRARQPRK